jgi:hypothetical protein
MDEENEAMKIRTLQLLAVSATYFSLSPALAAEATGTTAGTNVVATTDTTVAATVTLPASRIASRFESLAGSPQNAASLVAGLRSGSVITLGAAESSSGLSFTPATAQMGYGNITRALSLAQRQLAAQGILEPTPEQLRIALNGGTLTGVDASGATRSVEMPGVLQLRSQGMGWGQIAHRLDLSAGNRPPPPATGAASALPSAQAGVDLRASSQARGAIVSGDGSLMHGRAPGYGGAPQRDAQVQTRGSIQSSANAQGPAGRPSFATAGTSVGMSNHGRSQIQGRGNGRL